MVAKTKTKISIKDQIENVETIPTANKIIVKILKTIVVITIPFLLEKVSASNLHLDIPTAEKMRPKIEKITIITPTNPVIKAAAVVAPVGSSDEPADNNGIIAAILIAVVTAITT